MYVIEWPLHILRYPPLPSPVTSFAYFLHPLAFPQHPGEHVAIPQVRLGIKVVRRAIALTAAYAYQKLLEGATKKEAFQGKRNL